jgi:glycosyltransferase involved in cell wall biosynthesis
VTKRKILRVCIVYPLDPLGSSPGGIDSFIRGVLRWAPADIAMSVVGITTDPAARPPGKWSSCEIKDRKFDFYPILEVKNIGRQPKVPATLRFLVSLIRKRPSIDADILEFHRIEPCFAFLRDRRPKTLVMHQNMNVIRSLSSDIRWKYFPWMYFYLEKYVIARTSTVSCVREDAVESYKAQFAAQAHKFRFMPTWFDTEIFYAPEESERAIARERVREEFSIPSADRLFVWVGRIDHQKDPLLLLESFNRVVKTLPDTTLLMIGDGVLRERVESRIRELRLEKKIILCGVKPAEKIATYLRGADVFVLPSAYEGMPISVLEALGSGLPVVATKVGEIPRVVKSGVNGELVDVHEPDSVAKAMMLCLENLSEYRGEPSWRSAMDFTPKSVLKNIYSNYRRIAN